LAQYKKIRKITVKITKKLAFTKGPWYNAATDYKKSHTKAVEEQENRVAVGSQNTRRLFLRIYAWPMNW
jgi:hypothetical protein